MYLQKGYGFCILTLDGIRKKLYPFKFHRNMASNPMKQTMIFIETGGDRMKIGFYGAGRVGCTLGRYLKEHGVHVTGYYNRTAEKALEAARWTDTLCYDSAGSLVSENDAVFLTVSDQAIAPVVRELQMQASLQGKLLCHTSGALSSDVFAGTGAYGYSIHPLYAISNRKTSYQTLDHAWFTVEGAPEHLQDWLMLLSEAGLRCKAISAAEKVRYHASAVMASNLVCGLYAAAAEELVACGFGEQEAEEALAGLFLDNAEGIAKHGPVAQLTGPVERGDAGTVAKHLAVLSGRHKEAYLLLSGLVLRTAEKKNPDRNYEPIRELLK